MENEECGVRSAECGKRGVWKTRSVENAECRKCGVWKTRSVENTERGKRGVLKKIYKMVIKRSKEKTVISPHVLNYVRYNTLYSSPAHCTDPGNSKLLLTK